MYLECVLRLYSVEIELQVLFGVGVAVRSEASLEVCRCEGRCHQHRGRLVPPLGVFQELAYVLSSELAERVTSCEYRVLGMIDALGLQQSESGFEGPCGLLNAPYATPKQCFPRVRSERIRRIPAVGHMVYNCTRTDRTVLLIY